MTPAQFDSDSALVAVDAAMLADAAPEPADSVPPPAAERQRRHSWRNGDICIECGLHREGAGYGPYGAMRYYRDGSQTYSYKSEPCIRQADTVRPGALKNGRR